MVGGKHANFESPHALDLETSQLTSMSQGFATVKAVLSGDTLVLIGTAQRPGAAPPELQLSLSHLSAPRLSRHPEQGDEVRAAQQMHKRYAVIIYLAMSPDPSAGLQLAVPRVLEDSRHRQARALSHRLPCRENLALIWHCVAGD